MRRQTGFTLIELMIAIALTGMLLSMAVPAMDLFVSNARQTGAINDFVSSMHIARSTAITTNTRVTLCPSANGTTCEAIGWDRGWIVFADLDSDQIVDLDETITSKTEGINNLSIKSDEFGNFMLYRPNGRVMNAAIDGSAGEFTVCDERGADHAKVMIIELSGRPRLSKKLADGSAPTCT